MIYVQMPYIKAFLLTFFLGGGGCILAKLCIKRNITCQTKYIITYLNLCKNHNVLVIQKDFFLYLICPEFYWNYVINTFNSGHRFDLNGHVGKFERGCQNVPVKYVKQFSIELTVLFGKSHKFVGR